jgi:hypothetical protein
VDTPTAGLDPNQRNAYAAIQDMLREFGLEALAPKILGYVKQGFDTNTIGYELQQTQEWKTRFAANEVRKTKGLPVLTPQEYIATERSYRQIMSAAGLPVGFYDSTDDFRSFLERDISPTEVQSRVNDARAFIDRADPAAMAEFRRFYTTGDMVAFALDPERAAPVVGRAFNAATIAGESLNQGIGIKKTEAEALANMGIDAEQAQRGFSMIAGEEHNAAKLAAIEGQQLTVQDLIDETFRADSAAATKRRKLGANEQGRFGGSSGVGAGSLSSNSGGSL